MEIDKIQKIIFQNKVDKGFNVTDVNKEFCFLYGEVSEAYDAYRKNLGNVGEELADVAIYLFGLSEILGVDLCKEIEKKIEINQNRKYEERNGVLQKVSE